MIQIIISNMIKVKNCPIKLRAEITKDLTMDNPEYLSRKKRKLPVWGIDAQIKNYSVELNGDLNVPRGYFDKLCRILNNNYQSHHWDIVNTSVNGNPVNFGGWNTKFTLYPYQAESVAKFVHFAGLGGVIIAPAGSGKTNIALRCMYELKRPTLWLTHTKDLLYQTMDRAQLLMSDVGKIGVLGDDKRTLGDKKLIIATVQTLQQNPELIEILKSFIGFVIVDEAHRTPSSTFISIVNQFPARYMLGVTATPDRKDQLEQLMYLAIGPEIDRIDREQLYADGVLLKPEVRFIYTDFELKQDDDVLNVDAGGEDLNYHSMLKQLLDDDDRAQLIARHIVDGYRAHGTSIVLAESVRYCFALAERVYEIFLEKYVKYGVPVIQVVHGGLSKYTWLAAGTEEQARRAVNTGEALEMRKKGKRWEVKVEQYTDEEMSEWQLSKKERLEKMDKFRAGEINILFATQLAREGLDIPHLAIGHLVTPMRGDNQGRKDGAGVEQYIGRVMRVDRNNPYKKAFWDDYVDYNVGIFKAQYYSRRKVYERLGIKLPKKRKDSKRDEVDRLLSMIKY